MLLLPLLVSVVALYAIGCASIVPQGHRIAATPTDHEFELEAPRTQVFESLLSVAQGLNLSVDVLEKESGFIQFKNSALSSTQLDEYCIYPFVKAGTEQSWDTFTGWNQRSLRAAGGSVNGTVSLNILLTEVADGNRTHATLHSTWVASNQAETHEVNSKGVLERRIEEALRARLGLSSGE